MEDEIGATGYQAAGKAMVRQAQDGIQRFERKMVSQTPPSFLWERFGRKRNYGGRKGKNSIVAILEHMDYYGYTVNFKSYSKSHKLKKRIPTTKEQQVIFFNTHEAIVEDAVF